jgi:hypothetical protein
MSPKGDSNTTQTYMGIVGNERADQLARTESEHTFIGPEPACGISNVVDKKVVRD